MTEKVTLPKLNKMACQYSDQNVCQFIEQNAPNEKQSEQFSSSELNQSYSSDIDDQQNCKLFQLEPNFASLTSQNQSDSVSMTSTTSGPTPLPKTESLYLMYVNHKLCFLQNFRVLSVTK